jgi:pyridoxamine 5'-phosphate oxidase
MGLSVPPPGALPPWRPLLKAAQRREGRSPHARWLQLASLGLDGAPRVRTLVFRCWVDAHSLDLFTDGRSNKAAELQAEPRLELCWLLPKARCQFRLRGDRLSLNAEAEAQQRRRHWHQLSPGARALWGWPPPGAPFDPAAAFPSELADGSPLPECFELLRIQISQVELLELTGHPHQRRRWRADQGWAEHWLNP